MKHNVAASVLLVLSVFACKNPEIEPEYMISLDETSVSCTAEADELTVSLTCNGDWTLRTDDDDSWCEASAYKGSGNAEITFTVDPNPETNKRIIWYEFKCENKTADLRISQDGHVFSISVEPKELAFSAEDESAQEVTVTSSDDWTLEMEDDWCIPSATSGENGDKVSFTVKDYSETEKERTTTALFSCGDKTFELNIIQGAKVYSISVEPEELTFSAEDESAQEVTVTSSDNWTLKVEDGWCIPSATSGKNGDKVSFTVRDYSETEKERATTAVFSCGDKTFELNIIQGAKVYSISVEPEELAFSAEDESAQEVTVTSSDNWTLEMEDDWCIPSATSGENGDKVSFSVTEYLETEENRSTTVTFICGNKTAELEITQAAKVYSISVNPTKLTFSAEDESAQEVTVTSSDDWTLEVKDSWCTPSAVSGKNGDKVSFSVNSKALAFRETTAIFNCGNKTAEITVSQDGMDEIVIEPENFLAALMDAGVDTDGNGSISVEELVAVTTLDIDIQSAGTGQTYKFDILPSLQKLTIRTHNELDIIDISSHPKIESFSMSGIASDLVLRGCPRLYYIYAYGTLKYLDSYGCPSLEDLYCTTLDGTMMLDFGQCPALHSLAIMRSALENLDLHECASLEWISLLDNENLSSINLSQCKSLKNLTIERCYKLETLDLPECASLESISLLDNENLSSINLSQYKSLKNLTIERCYKLETLDLHHNKELEMVRCSSNTRIKTLDLSQNPALRSVMCGGITTLDVSGCTSLDRLTETLGEDLQTLYASGCTSLEFLILPESLEYIDLSECPKITNLKYYPGLQIGNTYGRLNHLDLHGCTSLKSLSSTYLRMGRLSFLNIQGCSSLTNLDCSDCKLTKLDLTGCVSLQKLDCSDNQLTILDLTECPSLQELNCNNNQLTILDLTECPSLQQLSCDGNKLYNISLGNNTAIKGISCSGNQLKTLDLSKYATLESLDVQFCELLTSLNLKGLTNLQSVYCSDNKLTMLELSKCYALEKLQCYENDITILDIHECKSITTVYCEYNPLTKIIVNTNHKLSESFISQYSDIIEYVD